MSRSTPSLRAVLGVVTLASLGPMLVWDVSPGVFPARAHEVLAATPLTVVALALLVHQALRRVTAIEFAKALLSAVAFVFWALNQLLPDDPRATLFNDIAVAAFVLDVVLVIVGWPSSDETPARPRSAAGAALPCAVSSAERPR
jgi:hypothetical protein